MFIHWGLFSQTQGYWRGRPFFGACEYLAQVFRVPNAEYAELAASFNPVNFSAREWARAAREAGFRYIVITAKHHEGFAMFDSPCDPFNIVAATPFARDPIRELADAARAEGLGFGFYYSQFLDWREADAGGNDWDFPQTGRDFEAYMERKALPQVEELLTRYGKIDIFWFDIPGTVSKEHSERFVDLARRLQPDIIVNSRIGNGLGDFQTFGDNEVPPAGSKDRPWESILTHNHSWGYVSHDVTFKTPRELIHTIAVVISRGGNCMINVGPMPDGRWPKPTSEDFAAVGAWMARNGESIYGAGQASLDHVPWGVITAKSERLYLHVFERPANGRLIVPDAASMTPERPRLLSGETLDCSLEGSDLVIELPDPLPDPDNTVIVVDVNGSAAERARLSIVSPHHGAVELNPTNARFGKGVDHQRVSGWTYFARPSYFASVVGLRGPENSISWDVRVLEPGTYWLEIEYAAERKQGDREALITFAGQEFPFMVLETGSVDPYRVTPVMRHELGRVTVTAAGVYELEPRPLPTTPGGYQINRRPVHLDSELFTFKKLILAPCKYGPLRPIESAGALA